MSDIQPGGYVLITDDRNYEVRGVESVTDKLVRLSRPGYPRQVNKTRVIAASADKAHLDQLCQAINGAKGTYDGRIRKADEIFRQASAAAKSAFEDAVAKIVARSISTTGGE